MTSFPFARRFIAALLVTTFTVTNIGASYARIPEMPPSAEPQKAGLEIPASLGKIETFYQAPPCGSQASPPKGTGSLKGPGTFWGSEDGLQPEDCRQKTIFYIQDAHDSLEAQENIAKLIRYLVEHHGVKTVFEEGYEGPVPTDSYFGFIKNVKIREKISYFLLDKLRLGGAEYAHINRFASQVSRESLMVNKKKPFSDSHSLSTIPDSRDFKLIGADDLALHRENIKVYRKVASHQKQILKQLDAIQSEVKSLANQTFPKELKNWMRMKERLDAGELPLADYIKRLMQDAGSRMQDTEKAKTPLLESWILHPESKKTEPFNSNKLLAEIDALENGIAHSFLKTDRDYKIFQTHKNLSLLKRLAEIKVTPEEFELALSALKETHTQEIADFVARKPKKSIVLSKSWETNIQSAVKFYEIARQREAAIEKTLNAYEAEGGRQKVEGKLSLPPSTLNLRPLPPAILVFGGFHKQGIASMLRRNGYSYYIISPKISGIDETHRTYYKQLMTAGHHDFEKPFLAASAHANRPPSLLIESEAFARTEIRQLYTAVADNPDLPPSLLDRNLNSRSRSEMREISTLALTLDGETPQQQAENFYRAVILKSPEGSALRRLVHGFELDIEKTGPHQLEGYFLDQNRQGIMRPVGDEYTEAESTLTIIQNREDPFLIEKFQVTPSLGGGSSRELLRILLLYLIAKGFKQVRFDDFRNGTEKFLAQTLSQWREQPVSSDALKETGFYLLDLQTLDRATLEQPALFTARSPRAEIRTNLDPQHLAQLLREKYLMDREKGEALSQLLEQSTQSISENKTIFSPDGKKLAEILPLGSIRYFDLNGRWILTLDPFDNPIEELLWDDKNQFQKINFWNVDRRAYSMTANEEEAGAHAIIGWVYDVHFKNDPRDFYDRSLYSYYEGLDLTENPGAVSGAGWDSFNKFKPDGGLGVSVLNVLSFLAADAQKPLQYIGDVPTSMIVHGLNEVGSSKNIHLWNTINYGAVRWTPQPNERVFYPNKLFLSIRNGRIERAYYQHHMFLASKGEIRREEDAFILHWGGNSKFRISLQGEVLPLPEPAPNAPTDSARSEARTVPFFRDDQGLLTVNPDDLKNDPQAAQELALWQRLERDGLRYTDKNTDKNLITPEQLEGLPWTMQDLRDEDITSPLKPLDELRAHPLKILFPQVVRVWGDFNGANNRGVYLNYAEGIDHPIIIKILIPPEKERLRHIRNLLEIHAAQLNDFAGTGPHFYGVTIDPKNSSSITSYAIQASGGSVEFKNYLLSLLKDNPSDAEKKLSDKRIIIETRLRAYGLETIRINFMYRPDGTLNVIDAGDLIWDEANSFNFNSSEEDLYNVMLAKREARLSQLRQDNSGLSIPPNSEANPENHARSEARSEGQSSENLKILSELLLRPDDRDWNLDQVFLAGLVGKSLGKTNKSGTLSFVVKPGWRYFWMPLPFKKEGYEVVVSRIKTARHFFEIEVTLAKDGESIPPRVFQVSRLMRALLKKDSRLKVRKISEKLGIELLAEELKKSPNHNWNNEKENLESLIGLNVGKTNLNGLVNFTPIKNHQYSWQALLPSHGDYEGKITAVKVQPSFFEFTVLWEKEGEQDILLTYQVGDRQRALRPVKKEKVQSSPPLVLEISRDLGIREISDLIQRPKDHNWLTDRVKIEGLVGKKVGVTEKGGRLNFSPAPYYMYEWSPVGIMKEDYEGVIVASRTEKHFFEFEVLWMKEGNPSLRKRYQVGGVRKTIPQRKKGAAVESMDVFVISNHLGLLELSELVTRSSDHDWTQENERIQNLVGKETGVTTSLGGVSFYPERNHSYQWNALGIARKGYRGVITAAQAYKNFFEFEVLWTKKTKQKPLRRVQKYQVGGLQKNLTRLREGPVDPNPPKSLKIGRRLGADELTKLLTFPPDTDWELPENQKRVERLAGKFLGKTLPNGTLTLTPHKNYSSYFWSALGKKESDYQASIVSAEVTGGLPRFTVDFLKGKEQIRHVFYLTRNLRKVRGKYKEKGKTEEVLGLLRMESLKDLGRFGVSSELSAFFVAGEGDIPERSRKSVAGEGGLLDLFSKTLQSFSEEDQAIALQLAEGSSDSDIEALLGVDNSAIQAVRGTLGTALKAWNPEQEDNPPDASSSRSETRNIETDLAKSSEAAASVFVPYEDIQNPRSEARRALFAMAYEIKSHKNTSLVIYGANLLDESLKPFRRAGVPIMEEDLKTARKRYGRKESTGRNVHFSLRAETLKRNLGEPILAFLSQNPEDIYAALLLARSNGRIPGIEKREGIYSLVSSLFEAAALKHLSELAIAIAA